MKNNITVPIEENKIKLIENEFALLTAFKAMLQVARKEGYEIEEKYGELDNIILEEYDLNVTDMVDNIEAFYNILKELPTLQND